MTMHRFSMILAALAMTAAAMLAGCGGDPAEKLYGAWKSETPGSDGKPMVLVIRKDSLIFKGQTIGISFRTVALNVEITNTADNKTLLLATGIGNESTELQGDLLPLSEKTKTYQGVTMTVKVKFVRISEEEAHKLTSGGNAGLKENGWIGYVATVW